MEVSPFPYQGPLRPEQVHGRDGLVADLVSRVAQRQVTALFGPRRYGKTSLLRRLGANLAQVATVWVDLYEVMSLADVAARFDQALAACEGPFATVARPLAASLSLDLGLVSVQLTGPARSRPDPVLALGALLEVLVKTAQRQPTLLVVDEFSSVGRVNGAAGTLGAALQHHHSSIGTVFAGSHPSTMKALFTSRPEPFYCQADLVELGPLTPEAVEQLVLAGFAATGRRAGPVPQLVCSFARGHPQRTMQLADACWRRTPPGGAAGPAVWADALQDVRQGTAQDLERLYSGFEWGERAVLRAVARSGSIYGAEAGLLGLSTGTATHARRTLLDSGDLRAVAGGGLAVVDPLLADWARGRFPI